MKVGEFAVVLALTRHALWAASELPADHAQRRIVRHQAARLQIELAVSADIKDRDRAAKVGRLLQWFDEGAQIDHTFKIVESAA